MEMHSSVKGDKHELCFVSLSLSMSTYLEKGRKRS